jgi:GNAT superfamily N-acetyltransferase
MPFGAWWVFHQLRVFKNQDYSVALIYDGDRIVHRDVVYPDFFRFPCMSTTDLILSDIWTDEDCRGQGLAAAAMQEIVRVYSRPGRVLWCITAEDNRPCIRVLEKSGFVYAGTGTRTRRWGLHALGAFELTGSV